MLEHVKAALKSAGRLVIVDMMPQKNQLPARRPDQKTRHRR